MPERSALAEAARLEEIAAEAVRDAAQAGDAAEGRLRARLGAATPGAGVLGADERSSAPAARLQWVLDAPAAVRGLPLATVGLAAALDGQVVAAAVVDVHGGERFTARRGGGARRDGHPVAVSGCAELAGALVGTGFGAPQPGRAGEARILLDVLERARDVRCLGAPALELCWVACGRLDGWFGRGVAARRSAAATLVAEEAGARCELPCPENDELLIAASPGLFDALRALVELGG